MEILENIVTTTIPTDSKKYYVAEAHMAVGNRLSQEPDYWVCKYGTEVKVYLGNAVKKADVEKAVRIMEKNM